MVGGTGGGGGGGSSSLSSETNADIPLINLTLNAKNISNTVTFSMYEILKDCRKSKFHLTRDLKKDSTRFNNNCLVFLNSYAFNTKIIAWKYSREGKKEKKKVETKRLNS